MKTTGNSLARTVKNTVQDTLYSQTLPELKARQAKFKPPIKGAFFIKNILDFDNW